MWAIQNIKIKMFGHRTYYFESRSNAIWTKKLNEIKTFDTYQKAYYQLQKLKARGYEGKIINITEKE
jgi:hypothetical protein